MRQAHSRLGGVAATSLKVGLSTVAGLVGWIVGGKILALELGAAGVGIFGLLRQLLQNLNVLSTFSGSTALVQGVASRSGERRAEFAHTVGWFFAAGGLMVAAVLFVGAPWLGPWLLPHPQSTALLRWGAVAVLAMNAQTYFTGLLNAHRAINALVGSQVMAPLSVLILAYPVAILVRNGSAAGLVLMLAVPGAAVGTCAMVQSWRAGWFRPTRHVRIERGVAATFFRMSAVLLVSGFLVTGTQYLLNRLVANRLGLAQAGEFWVAWTLSMTYVAILLNSYGIYYLPALSALRDRTSRNALIHDYLRLALLVMPLLVSVVVVVKPWVVLGMFSATLLPALKVMRWMLIGDFLKGISWVLAFPMVAFSEMRLFFWSEVLFNLGLAGLSWAWLAVGGQIEGLGLVFLVMYAIYLPLTWLYVARRHGFRAKASDVLAFLAGLSVVLGASASTWADLEVRPISFAVLVVLAAAFLLLVLPRWRRRAVGAKA